MAQNNKKPKVDASTVVNPYAKKPTKPTFSTIGASLPKNLTPQQELALLCDGVVETGKVKAGLHRIDRFAKIEKLFFSECWDVDDYGQHQIWQQIEVMCAIKLKRMGYANVNHEGANSTLDISFTDAKEGRLWVEVKSVYARNNWTIQKFKSLTLKEVSTMGFKLSDHQLKTLQKKAGNFLLYCDYIIRGRTLCMKAYKVDPAKIITNPPTNEAQQESKPSSTGKRKRA